MVVFCHICLRTDRKLRVVNDALSDLHDELCDFGFVGSSKFCIECEYLLKKCYNFKMKCQLAVKLVKVWKKEKASERRPLDMLASKMPLSPLSLCNSKNFKVYFYQASDLETPAPIETPISTNFQHIFTINLAKDNHKNTPKLQPFNYNIIEKDFIKEIDVKIEEESDESDKIEAIVFKEIEAKELLDMGSGENGVKNYENDNIWVNDGNIWDNEVKVDSIDVENVKDGESDVNIGVNDVKKGQTKVDVGENDVKVVVSDVKVDESDGEVSESDFNDTASNNDDLNIKTDSSTDEEIIRTVKKTPVRRKKIRKSSQLTLSELSKIKIHSESESEEKISNKTGIVDVEVIKKRLAVKFDNCGELKDESGMVIDKEFILNSLESMTMRGLKQIRKRVVYFKTISKDGIRLLAQIQKKYRNDLGHAFTIEFLPTERRMLDEFDKRQVYGGYVNAEHKCDLCYTGFRFKKMLDYHNQTAHNENRPLSCSICQMRFTTERKLNTHVGTHRVVFKCKLCPLITCYRGVMMDHYRSHIGNVYTCEKCQATFKTRSGFALHRITAHPTCHTCEACGRSFANGHGLNMHRKRMHPVEQSGEGNTIRNVDIIKCDECDATFVSEIGRTRHVAVMHGGRRAGERAGAGRRTLNKKPQYICHVCNVIEHTYGALTWHYRKEHPNVPMCPAKATHLCHLCGKGFSNVSKYNEHRNEHSGLRPYSCATCHKSFHRRVNLRVHAERHAPRRRECTHCGKRFPTAANLSSHVKSHLGVKQHVCDICSKGFLHASALTAHVRGVHFHIRRNRKHNRELVD